MNLKSLSLEPEIFWKLYSKEIINVLQKEENQKAYTSSKEWTSQIKKITEKIITEDYKIHTQREFYNIDIIGYVTNTTKQQYDWELKIAYEHENDKSWNGEICKLTHIIADLKIISAYFNFTGKTKIEEVLQAYINKLGKDRMLRVPENRWLFVFGPKLNSNISPFRAFTLKADLKVQEL
ncbi:MAG: hypothetical protein ABFD79_03180 [Phycisphaerales bacterium]